MSKTDIIHKKARHHRESDIYCLCQLTAQSQTGVMSCGKQYIWISGNMQVLTAVEMRTALSACGYETHHVHSDLCVYDWIQRKNGSDGKSQRKAQDKHCLFPQSWKMGWGDIGAMCQKGSDPQDLWRSWAQRKANLLHCGWYDFIEGKAFVTGIASDGRCVFPPVPPEKEAGLWTSGGWGYVVM